MPAYVCHRSHAGGSIVYLIRISVTKHLLSCILGIHLLESEAFLHAPYNEVLLCIINPHLAVPQDL